MVNKYNSIFSGPQIDEAIAGMQNVITTSDIANDFNGGTTRVASAALAETLYNTINAGLTTENIESILLSIPNSNIYTTVEKNKLAAMSAALIGSYATMSARAAAVNPVSYVGTELSVVIDDGTGRSMSQLSRWDIPSSSWKIARLYNVDEFLPVTVTAPSVFPLYSFNTTQFSVIKVLVCCVDSAGANRQIQEVLVSYVGTNTYISVYGTVGNNTTLFNLSTTMTGNVITLNATTTTFNSVISYKMTDMI